MKLKTLSARLRRPTGSGRRISARQDLKPRRVRPEPEPRVYSLLLPQGYPPERR